LDIKNYHISTAAISEEVKRRYEKE
jgi:hypothetical protein